MQLREQHIHNLKVVFEALDTDQSEQKDTDPSLGDVMAGHQVYIPTLMLDLVCF